MTDRHFILAHHAAEGMRFAQCYAGSTVCAPTRCCLMTGKHTGHATVRGNSARGDDGSILVPLRGFKRDLTEGGIRVQAIARRPGQIDAGSVSDFPWAFWDFLPTAAELAGADIPADVDGRSTVATLLGRQQTPAEFLYWEFFERGFQQAARWGQWKAIRNDPSEPIELYDLMEDIGEEQDVADQHSDVVQKMTSYLDSARTPSPYWPPVR